MNGSKKRPLNKTYIQFNFLKQWWLLALLSIIVERTQFMFHSICIPEEIILHYYTYTAVIASYFSHVCCNHSSPKQLYQRCYFIFNSKTFAIPICSTIASFMLCLIFRNSMCSRSQCLHTCLPTALSVISPMCYLWAKMLCLQICMMCL